MLFSGINYSNAHVNEEGKRVSQLLQSHDPLTDYHKELCITHNPTGKHYRAYNYVAKVLLPKKIKFSLESINIYMCI